MKKFVITIARQYGSGGRTIAQKVAERLGVPFYDKAVIKGLTEKFNVSAAEIERVKASRRTAWPVLGSLIMPSPAFDYTYAAMAVNPTDEVFKAEAAIVQELADEGPCVIAGRSGFFLLKDRPERFSVFIQAPKEMRIARVASRQSISEAEARKIVESVDEGRENYTKRYAGVSRYDLRNYDLVLNTGIIPEEQAVEAILAAIK